MEEEKKSKQDVAKAPDSKSNQKKAVKATEKRILFKKKKREQKSEEKEVKWVQIRLIPIWLRIFIVLVMLIVSAVIGAIIGYSIIGDGALSGVFKVETWKHILDMIQGIES